MSLFVWFGWVSARRFWGLASSVTVAGALLWFAVVSTAALRAPISLLLALFAGSVGGLLQGWAEGSRDIQAIKVRLASEAVVERTWRDPHPAFTSASLLALVLASAFALLRVPEVAVGSVSFLACSLAAASVFRFLGLRQAEREVGPIEVGRGIHGLSETGFAYRLKPKKA